jgi:NAD(P)H-hydrate repair Nnr-like enzyme with NAD(P)H-hydrate dehydratase domain
MPVTDAVLAGVHVHGLAGEIAAGTRGERAMTSGDVAAALGAAWRRIDESNIKE